MTALPKYDRLEATGLWRAAPSAQRREVIVTFGDATLVIAEPHSMTALAHWSLAAATRRNPGQMPALFAPGADAEEVLELDDAVMVAAIDKVHARIVSRRPRPGRLRGALLVAALALVLGLGVFWLPGRIERHTAAILPVSKQAELGQMVLTDLSRLTGAPCGGPVERRALSRLAARVFPGRDATLVVVPEALSGVRHLPGDIFAIGAPMVEDFETADVLSGYLLAEDIRAGGTDPLRSFLQWVGLRPTLGLLTAGRIDAAALTGYGEALIARPDAPVPAEPLLARMAALGIAVTPYAYGRDPSGETVLDLIEADPYRGTVPPAPALPDADWVQIQGICTG